MLLPFVMTLTFTTMAHCDAVGREHPRHQQSLVFRSKRGDRIKVLVWDGSGIVLTYKRLEQGKFAWPAVRDGVMRLSRAQFEALFEGLDWRRVHARRVRRPAAAE